MPQQNYLDELTPAFTPLLAIKEASRCLLCHDAPCSQACPAQTDPGKFIRSIYFRNFKGAAETIRENNALGAVCARVCPTEKLCQSGCTRAGVDTPIDIGRLQRFVTDFEQQTGMEIYQPGTKTLGKVAIIGAGPAGLQASVTLTNQGYDVTIYEKEAQPGGWLRNGIPQFRLPQSVLDAEIARIEKMGVTIKCNNEIGKTLTLEQLKKQTGVSALDLAKAMLDQGMHPPTMYFPLIVHEALMFEPTETETPETLDRAAQALEALLKTARENPQALHAAPVTTVIGRPDETAAARRPVVRYGFEEG